MNMKKSFNQIAAQIERIYIISTTRVSVLKKCWKRQRASSLEYRTRDYAFNN